MSLSYQLFLILLSFRGLESVELEVEVSAVDSAGTSEQPKHINQSLGKTPNEGVNEKAVLIKTYKQWGPNFHIRFEIKIKPNISPKISPWHNVLHFTTGHNFETRGSRIPGVWLYPSDSKDRKKIAAYLYVEMELNGIFHPHWQKMGYNNNKVELQQKHGLFSLIVNDVIEWSLPIGGQSYENVQFWLPDPWHLPAEDMADIKNVVVVGQ